MANVTRRRVTLSALNGASTLHQPTGYFGWQNFLLLPRLPSAAPLPLVGVHSVLGAGLAGRALSRARKPA